MLNITGVPCTVRSCKMLANTISTRWGYYIYVNQKSLVSTLFPDFSWEKINGLSATTDL